MRPRHGDRVSAVPRPVAAEGDEARERGSVGVAGGPVAVHLALVGRLSVRMPRMMRVGMWRAPFMLGLEGMGRMSKAMSATEGFHKQVEGPLWYLMTVGTRTVRQGQGLGSQPRGAWDVTGG